MSLRISGKIGLRSSTSLNFRNIALLTPDKLFAAGEQGVWYDPSDLSTLFQDSAGTTPVTAVEQPVGRILDKSRGLVLGSELVTNGTFTGNTTGWTPYGATFTAVSGEGVLADTGGTSGYPAAVVTLSCTIGKTYLVTGNARVISAAAGVRAAIFLSTSNSTFVGPITSTLSATAVPLRMVFVATSTTHYISLSIANGPSTTGNSFGFDNISVRELPGNHASQSTSASRPVLSARVNLLTRTEEFDNAAWTKAAVTVTANTTTAPDGTTTADALFETSTTAGHFVFTTVAGAVGIAYRASISLKANGRNYAFVRIYDGTPTVHAIVVDLLSGTASNATGTTNNITCVLQNNGFYRVSFDAVGGVSTTFDVLSSADGIYANRIFAGDATKGIYIWGADLRVANDGVGLPVYQRVGAATAGTSTSAGNPDYDTVGFPMYLRFDGTDDFLVTGTINPGSVDKAQVFAGVRKLSDAAGGVVVELSVTSAFNDGTLAFNAPAAGTPDYFWRSKGTISASSTTAASYPAPLTSVMTGIGDIAGDVSQLRYNGTQILNITTDQGTGNFGSYPLYIGARGGSSLRFNGHLYGLIVRFSSTNLSAIEIDAIEKWVNSKTRAY